MIEPPSKDWGFYTEESDKIVSNTSDWFRKEILCSMKPGDKIIILESFSGDEGTNGVIIYCYEKE